MMIFKATILLESAAALLGVLELVVEGSGATGMQAEEDVGEADVDEAGVAVRVAEVEADVGEPGVAVNGEVVEADVGDPAVTVANAEAAVAETDAGVTEAADTSRLSPSLLECDV